MGNIASYLGFAVKSAKIIYGIDNLTARKKRVYALVLCPTAAANLRESAERYSQRTGVPLITTKQPLEDLVFKSNCKLVALLDANMAKAVIETAGR